jgi:hypothetical protein
VDPRPAQYLWVGIPSGVSPTLTLAPKCGVGNSLSNSLAESVQARDRDTRIGFHELWARSPATGVGLGRGMSGRSVTRFW